MVDDAVRAAVAVLDQSSVSELTVSACFVITVVTLVGEVVVISQRTPSRRRSLYRSLLTGLPMAFGGMCFGVLYASIVRSLWPHFDLGTSAGQTLSRLPGPVAFITTFVVWDAATWLYHWIGHHSALGWAAHQPHHSGSHIDLTIGLRQTWLPIHIVPIHATLAMLGFDLEALVVCAAVNNCYQFLMHSDVMTRFPGPLEAIVCSPATHRLHHLDRMHPNLGAVFTIWDRAARRWRAATDSGDLLAMELPSTENPLRLEFSGWQELFRGRRPNGSTVR